MDFETTNLIPIPLPTEVPQPPSLDKLPLEILHSATVETLIQQNEDLSARLKVNIRRNSIQEQNLLNLKKEMQILQQKNDSIKAQMEIVLEKESLWKNQRKSQTAQVETVEKEKQLLELRYNELYTTSQYRHKELQDQLIDKGQLAKSLTAKLDRLKKLKERGKDKVRELLLTTVTYVNEDHVEKRRLAGQNNLYQNHLMQTKKRFEEREMFLKNKLAELSEISKTHLRELEGRLKAKDNQIAIKDKKLNTIEFVHKGILNQEIQLERQKQQEMQAQIEDLHSKLKVQENNQARISRLSSEMTSLRNEKIQDYRDLQSQIDTLSKANKDLQTENVKVQKSFGELSTESFETQKALEACEKKIVALSQDNKALEKENQSLKNLWFDLQGEFEKEQLKNESLAKLNQSLGQKPTQEKVRPSIEQSFQKNAIVKTKEKEKEKEKQVIKEGSKGPVNNIMTEVYASQYQSLHRQKPRDAEI